MRAQPVSLFTRTKLVVIIAVTAGSLALGLLFIAFSENIGEPFSVGNDLFSFSALGHKAVSEMLRRSGVPVFVRRSGWPGPLGPRTPLVVAEPSLPVSEDNGEDEGEGMERPPQLVRMLEMARQAHAAVLVILPKWTGIPDVQHPRWVDSVVPR